jgi:hypothetical protein
MNFTQRILTFARTAEVAAWVVWREGGGCLSSLLQVLRRKRRRKTRKSQRKTNLKERLQQRLVQQVRVWFRAIFKNLKTLA